MVKDLIYDIGMHDAADTAYYLHKGYRVVAVDANPAFVEDARARFKKEIASEKLTLLGVALSDQPGVAQFWVNKTKTDWSSLDKDVAGRNSLECYPVTVPCLRLSHVLDHFGVPYYLKIDIEGHDRYCLKELNRNDLPQYISVEAHTVEYLFALSELGYDRFKLINQARAHVQDLTSRTFLERGRQKVFGKPERDWDFKFGCSGHFGEETPGPWFSKEEVAYRFLTFHLKDKTRWDEDMFEDAWYDFHATKSA